MPPEKWRISANPGNKLLPGLILSYIRVPVPDQWAKAFGEDTSVAGAMLDRLLHRSVVITVSGDSYRMRAHRARAERLRGGQK